jgi:glucokinase
MPQHLIIGLDIGGTKIQAGLVTQTGRVLRTTKVATEARRGRAVILKNIESAIRAVWQPGVRGIGIGIAGEVDWATGTYVRGANFPVSFRNIPLARILRKRFRVPVKMDNDVHCFALGEARFGAGKGRSIVVGITLGTGVGGGVVMDGVLFRGRHNLAGEVGHMIIAQGSPRSRLRKRDGFEDFVSGTALSRMYREHSGKSADALTVERLAIKGDRAAKSVISTMRASFAAGIASILHAFDPDIIIVGGGINRVKALWPGINKEIRGRLVYPTLGSTPVVKARLGDIANIVGAALLMDRSGR